MRSTLDIEELERLEKAATPGPWYVSPDDGYTIRRGYGKCRSVAAVSLVDIEIGVRDSKIDAGLIAALRNAAPALIAAARESAERRTRGELVEALNEQAEAQRSTIANLREVLKAAEEFVREVWTERTAEVKKTWDCLAATHKAL